MIWDQLAPALGINLESNNFQVVNIFKTEDDDKACRSFDNMMW